MLLPYTKPNGDIFWALFDKEDADPKRNKFILDVRELVDGQNIASRASLFPNGENTTFVYDGKRYKISEHSDISVQSVIEEYHKNDKKIDYKLKEKILTCIQLHSSEIVFILPKYLNNYNCITHSDVITVQIAYSIFNISTSSWGIKLELSPINDSTKSYTIVRSFYTDDLISVLQDKEHDIMRKNSLELESHLLKEFSNIKRLLNNKYQFI